MMNEEGDENQSLLKQSTAKGLIISPGFSAIGSLQSGSGH